MHDPIHILDKRLTLYQSRDGLKTSTDSILLAAACPIKPNESILDLGCGIGSAGLCVLQRVDNTHLTGIDIQSDHIHLAHQNAALNNFEKRCDFIHGDIRKTSDLATYDHVICNPPYMPYGKHIQSPSPAKARAMGHIEDNITLQNWITCAWNHIKGQGSLTIIHDAGQSDDILHSLYSEKGGKRFGNVEIFPIFSRIMQPAKRIIIRAYKHKKSPAILYPGITMHEGAQYSYHADRILRHAESLDSVLHHNGDD